MPDSDGRQIAANTQAIRGLRGDVQEIKQGQSAVLARVRVVEGHLGTLAAERREERRIAKQRQDTIKLWLMLLTAAIGCGSLLLSAALVIAAFHFHR